MKHKKNQFEEPRSVGGIDLLRESRHDSTELAAEVLKRSMQYDGFTHHNDAIDWFDNNIETLVQKLEIPRTEDDYFFTSGDYNQKIYFTTYERNGIKVQFMTSRPMGWRTHDRDNNLVSIGPKGLTEKQKQELYTTTQVDSLSLTDDSGGVYIFSVHGVQGSEESKSIKNKKIFATRFTVSYTPDKDKPNFKTEVEYIEGDKMSKKDSIRFAEIASNMKSVLISRLTGINSEASRDTLEAITHS